MSGEAWHHAREERCPVCGVTAPRPTREGARALLRCPRCGDHWVDEAMWAHLWSGLPIRTRRQLTAGLRAAHEEGEHERLLGEEAPAARVEKLIAPIQPLDTVQQRMDATVLLVGTLLNGLGESEEFENAFATSASLQCLGHEGLHSLVLALETEKLASCKVWHDSGAFDRVSAGLTPAGWARYEQLRTTSTDSKRVFLAMSNRYGEGLTDEEHAAQADALLAAIRAALPHPLFGYRVEKDVAVDQITDAIVAGIRRAPFVIADLTAERPNVYFEAGMALGLGKPVVFCRRKGETAHFDVQAYKLIEWEPDKLGDFTARLDAHLQARGLTPARDPG